MSNMSSHTTSFSLISLSPIHILRIESLVRAFLRAWDRVHFERARASAVVCGRACFVSNSFFDLNVFWRVGGGVRSRILPKECRAFFPKTTVSWLRIARKFDTCRCTFILYALLTFLSIISKLSKAIQKISWAFPTALNWKIMSIHANLVILATAVTCY